MTGFVHRMPFGAQKEPDGTIRFRLWAPAERSVSLHLHDSGEDLPMAAAAEGWFEVRTSHAAAGSRYSFVLADGLFVPDPASRAQAGDPNGPSIVVDPLAYPWRCRGWRGRPWREAVLYELHVGTFIPEGTFEGVRGKLDALAAIGINALELMPLSDFSGARNWGYDGVLPFAPDARYGPPDALKALIDAAHERGIMMFLDVVYNHFGPEGNYLGRYAPAFFTERHHTPWGAAIDFSQRPVRDYFIHNALYWLQEYRFDGLRFDAVHAIIDVSSPDILEEIAAEARHALPNREIHLVLENDRNRTAYLRRDGAGAPKLYTAQWNDDFHHAAHALLTGESAGYYMDYKQATIEKIGRALAEGFIYQGEPSPFRHGEPRGEPTVELPPEAFVNFLQNHDQIGNRAFGERLTTLASPDALRALRTVHLLAPAIPLLFMGEEWESETPFQYFCQFEGALAEAVRKGRWQEFARFPEFASEESRPRFPDPGAAETFLRSRLDWTEASDDRLLLTRTLLAIRARIVVPLTASQFHGATASTAGTLAVTWRYASGSLALQANLTDAPIPAPTAPAGDLVFATHEGTEATLPPWFVRWTASEAP